MDVAHTSAALEDGPRSYRLKEAIAAMNTVKTETLTDLPALAGGQPVTRKEFPPYNTIDDAEKRAVMEVLDSGVLSAYLGSPAPEFKGGPRVRSLEDAWAEQFGIKHAVSMNSATSALCAAVAACQIGYGDEVITSPLTMTATATAALANGAVPVFADVEPDTLNLDPASVAACVTKRTRAIMVVHLAGYPVDMDPIMELAAKHDLYVLEDAAQSPAARYKSQYAGCIGHIGVFSLNCHKTIQCGEGGIAVTEDDDLAMRLCLIRNHGEACLDGFDRPDAENLIGYNLRMTELEAAIALCQLAKLEKLNEGRIELANYLSKRITEEFDCLRPPNLAADRSHVYYFYPVAYDAARAGLPIDLFAHAVQAEGIPLLARWNKPLYHLRIYQQRSARGQTGWPFVPPWYDGSVSYDHGICPVAEAVGESLVFFETLLRWPNTIEDMELAVQAIRKVLDGRHALLAVDDAPSEGKKS